MTQTWLSNFDEKFVLKSVDSKSTKTQKGQIFRFLKWEKRWQENLRGESFSEEW